MTVEDMFRDPRKQKHKASHSEVHLTSFRINDRALGHNLVLAVSCWELKSPCIKKKKKWHKLFGLLNPMGGQCPSLCQVVAPPDFSLCNKKASLTDWKAGICWR